jgi:hypothetical protein
MRSRRNSAAQTVRRPNRRGDVLDSGRVYSKSAQTSFHGSVRPHSAERSAIRPSIQDRIGYWACLWQQIELLCDRRETSLSNQARHENHSKDRGPRQLEQKAQAPCSLIFSPSQLNLEFHGGVAQLVRARGSYPRRRRFDSAHRHHFHLGLFTREGRPPIFVHAPVVNPLKFPCPIRPAVAALLKSGDHGGRNVGE